MPENDGPRGDPTHLDELVDAFDEVCRATLTLVRGLGEDQAARPTACPGWTVKDQLSHMVGLEQVLAGAPQPTTQLPELAHVSSDLDRYMEAHVQVRRDLPLVSVADELDGMLPRRLAQLRTQVAEGDPEVISPMGKRPLSVGLPIRVFDLWIHEQDIRRAVGERPRLDGVASRLVAERTLAAWSAGLAAKFPGRAGTVIFQATGSDGGEVEVEVDLGPGGSMAVVRADIGVLSALGVGRGEPAVLLGEATVDGDRSLVEALLPHLAFTP